METLEPEPFGAEGVHESVADGFEAGAEVASELLVAERGAGIEGAMIGPRIVFEESTDIVGVHGNLHLIRGRGRRALRAGRRSYWSLRSLGPRKARGPQDDNDASAQRTCGFDAIKRAGALENGASFGREMVGLIVGREAAVVNVIAEFARCTGNDFRRDLRNGARTWACGHRSGRACR